MKFELFSIYLRWRWFPICLRSLWRRWLQSVPVMPLYWLQKKLRFAFPPFLKLFIISLWMAFLNLACNSILLSDLRRRTRLEICSVTQRRQPQIRNERDGRRSWLSAWRFRSARRGRNWNRLKVERIRRKAKLKLNRPSRNLLKEEKPKSLRLVTIVKSLMVFMICVEKTAFPYKSLTCLGLKIFFVISCRMMAWIRLFVPLKHFSHNYKTKLKARSRGPKTRQERKRNKKKFLCPSWNYNNIVCHVKCTVFLFKRTQSIDITCHFSCVCVSVLSLLDFFKNVLSWCSAGFSSVSLIAWFGR